MNFYPRSPCGERRRIRQGDKLQNGHFYPRSPCGERQAADMSARREASISIHALLAESDRELNSSWISSIKFLSTLSLRRATVGAIGQLQCIHDFYPRSPCGERPIVFSKKDRQVIFLSTLSLRRATTAKIRIFDNILDFYPRSPCGERQDTLTDDVSTGGFLSTLSLRRAT